MSTDQLNLYGELSTAQAWALLREAEVGRLAVVVDGHPDIFPVNYLVDHGSVLIRTADGTKFAGASGKQVAFEADGYDSADDSAWSVVLKGEGEHVQRLHDILDVIELPLLPWDSVPKPHYLRVTAESITGRRFLVTGTAG
jgi:nitroimidazol reductase NimA-like FMN-containing flavoprotein (pyridoxamine 5'-phosphate oxidase superfamily)